MFSLYFNMVFCRVFFVVVVCEVLGVYFFNFGFSFFCCVLFKRQY